MFDDQMVKHLNPSDAEVLLVAASEAHHQEEETLRWLRDCQCRSPVGRAGWDIPKK